MGEEECVTGFDKVDMLGLVAKSLLWKFTVIMVV